METTNNAEDITNNEYPPRTLLIRRHATTGSESEMEEMTRHLNEFYETLRRFSEQNENVKNSYMYLRKKECAYMVNEIKKIQRFIELFKELTVDEENDDNNNREFNILVSAYEKFLEKSDDFNRIVEGVDTLNL